jgi:hypothetical protein
MSTNLPFTYKIGSNLSSPFPGAYIFTGTMNASNGMVPVSTSMPRFDVNGMSELLNDKDAQVLVLPGYSLELYTDVSFVTLNTTVDNSSGTDMLFRNASLTASSCKLFFKFLRGYAEITYKP